MANDMHLQSLVKFHLLSHKGIYVHALSNLLRVMHYLEENFHLFKKKNKKEMTVNDKSKILQLTEILAYSLF